MYLLLLRVSVASIFFIACLFSQFSNANPALFKLEKNGITSYLFGTVHVGTPDMKTLPKNVMQAIEASEKVVVEVDLETLSPMQVQKVSKSYMQLPKGKTLADMISLENYQKLKNYFAQVGINITHFSSHRPWAVMITLLQLEYQKLGFSEQYGIDKQVLAYASKKHKKVLGLETLEQQLTMLSSLEALNNEMFNETFKHLNDIEFYFVDLVTAWKTGDMDKLSHYYQLSFDDSKYGQFSEQVMLTSRNNQWVQTLTPLLTQQSLFIAVGALHLPEQYGLINQFKKAGFKVTNLSSG
ncbi:hypothetical protein PSECIP111951_02802 [Pseudoalteromonas holothuriae]|uniref:TraB/GumN family protein n=1 Tax=Pseudoalteromonas holothuriae TaxID=2963714 RepID=A0ABN8UNC5_9GAMM|nr:TraB/GumN family protein [Pseudoalteromonas sp. CIP111951]CAH9062931.1 hypothetical protein PSECIP111951_02802 [Pseudoalteromonas sp. CIP111951]